MSKTIIKKEKDLDKLLKQKTNYTYKYLCRYLNLKKDYELMEYLSNYFNKKLDNYNFESDVKNNKYLSKLEKYFGYSLGKINLDKKTINDTIKLLNNITNKIKIMIVENIDKNSTKTAIENSTFLLTIEENLEKIKSLMIEKLEYPNKIEIITENKLTELLKILAFEVKNASMVEAILDNFPNTIIAKDFDNKLILEKIIDKHFNNLVNKDDYYEKLYYDKIIDLWTNRLYICKDKQLEETFYIKMSKLLNSINDKNLDDKKKNFILADLNERIMQFENLPQIDFLKREEDSYYQNIDFDILKELTGTNREVNRKDMTKKHIITIDNPEAKVLENALSVEQKDNKYLLSIYTTDVSSFISENKMFERKTYNTILEGSHNRLFNSKYKYNHFNMKKGKTIPAIAYQFVVDKDFNVSSFNFQRADIVVKDNLKFTDFNNLEKIKDENTKLQIETLIELVYPYLPDSTKIDDKTASELNFIINNKLAKVITEYTYLKNLPLIYRRENRDYIPKIIEDLEKVQNIDLTFLRYSNKILDTNIYTIGNDETENEDNINISIFSPARKLDALINQMLINIYLVEHKKLDPYTKNYLETRLDKIAENINKNKLDNYTHNLDLDLVDVKQNIKKN